MVKSIVVDKIVNGYTTKSYWGDAQHCVYHQDLPAAFKHLNTVFSAPTQVEYTGEIKYKDASK